MDDMKWLLEWYKSQCDCDWEHANGIKIETMDNPGWFFEVSINETELQDLSFDMLKMERSGVDWYHCLVEGNFFKGYGGIFNLLEILQVFRKWAEGARIEK